LDFVNAQRQAHRRTGKLVVLFAGAVVGLILLLWAVVSCTLVLADPSAKAMWDLEVLLLTALGTLGVVGSGTLYRMHQLRGLSRQPESPARVASLSRQPESPARVASPSGT
jgi:hypothetical protein